MQLNMIINYRAKNVHRVEGMFFKPGNNQIDIELWAAAQRNPLLRKKVESGMFKVVSLPPGYNADGSVKDQTVIDKHVKELEKAATKENAPMPVSDYVLGDLDQADAEDIIKGTLDLKLLGEWAGKETRKNVRKAIDQRVAYINKKNEELVDKK